MKFWVVLRLLLNEFLYQYQYHSSSDDLKGIQRRIFKEHGEVQSVGLNSMQKTENFMDEKEYQSSCSLGMDRSYEEEETERIITRKRKRKRTPKRLNTRTNEEFSTSHNQMAYEFTLNQGIFNLITTGQNFVLHVVSVNAGEEILAEILSFVERCARDVYIMSANGFVSHVGLSCFGGTSIDEGCYDIVSFKGFLSPTIEYGGDIADTLSISVAGSDGSVFGAVVSESLIAASQIQIVLCSFGYSPLTTTSVPGSSDSEVSSAESS